MSKYKSSYGKARGPQRAGLQFDKLLKACSNSKVAGAVGRFGVTQFTSTRSNLDSTGEEEKQVKPSRFSSLNKRPRLEPLHNLQEEPFAGANQSSFASHPPVLQQQTVLKPRKFFKSRGPMEVEVDLNRPIHPPYIPPIPILSNISNSSKSAGVSGGTNNTFGSPPIKLKIIKDKGKFVSVSGNSAQPAQTEEKVDGRGRRKSATEKTNQKSPKRLGRGRPPKSRERERSESPSNEDVKEAKKAPPPPNPKRAAGRVTRSSAKYEEVQKDDDGNQNDAPIRRVQGVNNHHKHTETQNDTLKKLENDEEFQQLSRMMSSLEEDDSPTPVQQYSQNSMTSLPSSSSNRLEQNNWAADAVFSPPQQPKPKKERDPQDIQAILEDEWSESFDEDSPRKSGTVADQNPIVSRFDPSAFSSNYKSPSRPSIPHFDDKQFSNQNQSYPGFPQTSAARAAPLTVPAPLHTPPTLVSAPVGQGQLNSSPYAMKNLLAGDLSSSQESSSQGSVESDFGGQQDSQEDDISSQKIQETQSTDSGVNSQGQVAAKLAVQPKKASIFKSRAAATKEKKAVYKHTFGQRGDEEEKKPPPQPPGRTLYEDDEEVDLGLTKSGGGDSEEIGEDGKVFCKKGAKKLFTVIRNVKASHELQESGEFHEFDGDVYYILEDLKAKNPMNSRCLSAITLASRCMDQAFRMHLRAHGTVAEFCKELHDAPQHPVLSLLAATVLFVLSQDRLNMDLDTESLKLILALTKADSSVGEIENAETVKNRQRVVQLCSEMKNRGHAKLLNLEKITASELALETLLYLTSKRAGEWVKHELRTLGGLDSIVDEVQSSFHYSRDKIQVGRWDDDVADRLRKIDRCLAVLGVVTFNHEDNQRYLIQLGEREIEATGKKIKCTPASPMIFLEIFNFCKEFLVESSHAYSVDQSGMIREVLFLILRLMVNFSHDYRGIVLGSELIMKLDGFLELSLHSVFEMTSHFPDEKVFDLLIHSLCILLNLVETSKVNRASLLKIRIRRGASGFRIQLDSDESTTDADVPLLDAFIEMFLQRELTAKKEEQHTDNILTTGDKTKQKSSQSDKNDSQKDDQEGTSVQDTIDKLIQTAGKHMESSLVAAYVSLLIGFLVMDDKEAVERVRNMMPDKCLLPLMVELKKLFNFMSITNAASGSARGLKATSTALKFYAKMDPPSAQALKQIIPE